MLIRTDNPCSIVVAHALPHKETDFPACAAANSHSTVGALWRAKIVKFVCGGRAFKPETAVSLFPRRWGGVND